MLPPIKLIYMTSVAVAVKLWAKTLVMNAVLFGVGGIFIGEYWRAPASVLCLIGGFIITLPLLMLITPLVRMSTWLPYSIPAKIGWLSFSLMLGIIIFYSAASLLMEQKLFSSGSPINTCMGCTMTGLLIAILTTRRSLIKLHAGTGDKDNVHGS